MAAEQTNRHKHLHQVTIMRTDGTPWVLNDVKHVILKPDNYAFYLGEHGAGRKLILVPTARVDHLIVDEK